MSSKKPSQGVDTLHKQALKLLLSYAVTAKQAADYDWSNSGLGRRVAELNRFIKRDLAELKVELDNMTVRHRRVITSAVLNNPSHPTMLKCGGDYYNYFDRVNSIVSPHTGELMDLIAQKAAMEKVQA